MIAYGDWRDFGVVGISSFLALFFVTEIQGSVFGLVFVGSGFSEIGSREIPLPLSIIFFGGIVPVLEKFSCQEIWDKV